MFDSSTFDLALNWLQDADGILVSAGAGMGVDSGLPDFRGDGGFWGAYPGLRKHNLGFEEIASPRAFRQFPRLAWGFFGHCQNLYRKTKPHQGFNILLEWSTRLEHGLFVFTSNIDGQFQKAGFTAGRIVECHGSIHRLQCIRSCTETTWSANSFNPVVDEENSELLCDLPTCPRCGELARPNVLLFHDYDWLNRDTDLQTARLNAWASGLRKLVVVELGAGRVLPTVRSLSERHGPRVIRINPRDSAISPRVGIGIAGGGLETLKILGSMLDN